MVIETLVKRICKKLRFFNVLINLKAKLHQTKNLQYMQFFPMHWGTFGYSAIWKQSLLKIIVATLSVSSVHKVSAEQVVCKTLNKLEVLVEAPPEAKQLWIFVTSFRVVCDWCFFDKLWFLTAPIPMVAKYTYTLSLSLHNLQKKKHSTMGFVFL